MLEGGCRQQWGTKGKAEFRVGCERLQSDVERTLIPVKVLSGIVASYEAIPGNVPWKLQVKVRIFF